MVGSIQQIESILLTVTVTSFTSFTSFIVKGRLFYTACYLSPSLTIKSKRIENRLQNTSISNCLRLTLHHERVKDLSMVPCQFNNFLKLGECRLTTNYITVWITASLRNYSCLWEETMCWKIVFLSRRRNHTRNRVSKQWYYKERPNFLAAPKMVSCS